MCMTERMFVINGAFLFGYCLGYYPFDRLRYKKKEDRKHEIHEFFLSFDKKYGMQRRFFDKKKHKSVITFFLEMIYFMKKSF